MNIVNTAAVLVMWWTSPQNLIMEFEIMVITFVYAHRTRNFSMYVESLDSLVQWFFALDHINYAR